MSNKIVDVRELIITFSFECVLDAMVYSVPTRLLKVTQSFKGRQTHLQAENYRTETAQEVFDQWMAAGVAQGYYVVDGTWFPTSTLKNLKREEVECLIELQ